MGRALCDATKGFISRKMVDFVPGQFVESREGTKRFSAETFFENPFTDLSLSLHLCLSVSATDGRVYAFGGMGPDTTPQALVRVYEAERDEWQPLSSMPTPRYGATPFVRGNKIYLMGESSLGLSLSFSCSLFYT